MYHGWGSGIIAHENWKYHASLLTWVKKSVYVLFNNKRFWEVLLCEKLATHLPVLLALQLIMIMIMINYVVTFYG